MSGSTSNFLWQGQPIAPQPTGSDTANSFPLWLQTYTYNLANAAQNLAATPYTPFPGQQVATPSQTTQNAWGMAENNVGNYTPALNAAVANTSAAAAPIQTPSPLTAQSITANRIANPQTITANPVTSNAISASDINQYMNPYENSVVGALRQAANENLFTDVLPNVQDRFVSAGQSRSPQEMQATNNAIYKSQQALDQAIAGSLERGYSGALNTAAQQQGFLTNLATQQQGFQTGLAQQQQGVQLGLDTNQQQFLTNLAQQERDRQLALDQYNQTTGLNVAQGNRAAAQGAGAQYGQLGALTQQLGAADVGQLASAGQAQDQTNQANINAALNNFYSQQQWPYQNLGFASNVVRGLPVNTNQQVVGQTYNVPYSPSPLSQFLGTTLGASALGLKDGGHVRRRDGALAVWKKV
jgi:hypothetical protein